MWDKKMWDGHSCPSPLTLGLDLDLDCPSILRPFLVSGLRSNPKATDRSVRPT
jgi:hypothetical protein